MATQKKSTPATSNKTTSSYKSVIPAKPSFDFAFERINYIWMLIGLALLALGYILLVGGGATNPDEFNNALFDTRRLVIAPILMVAGIIVEICAILLKPKKKSQENTNE